MIQLKKLVSNWTLLIHKNGFFLYVCLILHNLAKLTILC